MNYRRFGKTDLRVSEIGFGAWAIGGPSMAGSIPIGWGAVDDSDALQALRTAYDRGINFYDTADFYGLGHSETLLGKEFANNPNVIIATKVGHRLKPDQSIYTDYSKQYIIEACEDSLKRLRRESIDYYQLHTARLNVLREGDCIEAMHELQESGKIRYWGLSLNTFSPEPEADYLIEHQLGHGIQLVLNVLNQRAIGIIRKTSAEGYGIIARMPLQFGLLTGKFDMHTRFSEDDHRSFRLTSSILEKSIPALQKIWPLAEKYDISKTALSLSFILNFDEVSTVIPGMKNSEQVISNTSQITTLTVEDMQYLTAEFERSFHLIVDEMQLAG